MAWQKKKTLILDDTPVTGLPMKWPKNDEEKKF